MRAMIWFLAVCLVVLNTVAAASYGLDAEWGNMIDPASEAGVGLIILGLLKGWFD